jgi:hypothetical protein
MIKSISSVSAAVLFGALMIAPAMAQTTTAPAPGGTMMKLSQAECTSLWNKLDTSKSGSVAQTAAQPYVNDFKAADANNDGKLSQAEFTAACNKGLVHDTASTGTGTGGTAPKK